MAPELEASKQSGTFSISPGRDLHGELTLAGPKTSLYLRDKEFFSTDFVPDGSLKGILHDLTRVTLIGCVSPGPGTAHYGTESYHFGEIFPHYVIYGGHVGPQEERITEVQFVMDDASTLFYGFDAFGQVMDAGQFIGPIITAREKAFNRQIKTGPAPQILYFAGNLEIFAADTVWGRISASHHPSSNLGGPKGVWLKNTISVSITFEKELVFDDAISRTLIVLGYLGVLVGRPLNILSLRLLVRPDAEGAGVLQVYWSMETVLIVLLVLFLLGGGGWGYSRWRG
jgi:hypothetical protein